MSVLSVWHFAHASTVLSRHDVVFGSAVSWALWQSMQTGTSALPFASARPCTLLPKTSATSEWQAPHVSETRVRGASGFAMSCAPWQSVQNGAPPPFWMTAKCTPSSAFV